jgi:hypothetical protein
MHAICPTKLNLFDLGTLIKWDGNYIAKGKVVPVLN